VAHKIAAIVAHDSFRRPPLTAFSMLPEFLEDAVLGRENWSNYTKSTAANCKVRGTPSLTLSNPVKADGLIFLCASTLGQPGREVMRHRNAFLDALHISAQLAAWIPERELGRMGLRRHAARLSRSTGARWERQGIRVMECGRLRALESAITNQSARRSQSWISIGSSSSQRGPLRCSSIP